MLAACRYTAVMLAACRYTAVMLAVCRYTAVMLAVCRYTAIMLAACTYTAVMLAPRRYTAIIRFLQEKLKDFPRTFYSVYSSVAISHKHTICPNLSAKRIYICVSTLRKTSLYSYKYKVIQQSG